MPIDDLVKQVASTIERDGSGRRAPRDGPRVLGADAIRAGHAPAPPQSQLSTEPAQVGSPSYQRDEENET